MPLAQTLGVRTTADLEVAIGEPLPARADQIVETDLQQQGQTQSAMLA